MSDNKNESLKKIVKSKEKSIKKTAKSGEKAIKKTASSASKACTCGMDGAGGPAGQVSSSFRGSTSPGSSLKPSPFSGPSSAQGMPGSQFRGKGGPVDTAPSRNGETGAQPTAPQTGNLTAPADCPMHSTLVENNFRGVSPVTGLYDNAFRGAGGPSEDMASWGTQNAMQQTSNGTPIEEDGMGGAESGNIPNPPGNSNDFAAGIAHGIMASSMLGGMFSNLHQAFNGAKGANGAGGPSKNVKKHVVAKHAQKKGIPPGLLAMLASGAQPGGPSGMPPSGMPPMGGGAPSPMGMPPMGGGAPAPMGPGAMPPPMPPQGGMGGPAMYGSSFRGMGGPENFNPQGQNPEANYAGLGMTQYMPNGTTADNQPEMQPQMNNGGNPVEQSNPQSGALGYGAMQPNQMGATLAKPYFMNSPQQGGTPDSYIQRFLSNPANHPAGTNNSIPHGRPQNVMGGLGQAGGAGRLGQSLAKKFRR